MATNTEDIDDIQRWFYGGSPPAGDNCTHRDGDDEGGAAMPTEAAA